jgi:hypothetical protein
MIVIITIIILLQLDFIQWLKIQQINNKQHRQVTYNVTLRRIRITIVEMETEQYVSFLLLQTYIQLSTIYVSSVSIECNNGLLYTVTGL